MSKSKPKSSPPGESRDHGRPAAPDSGPLPRATILVLVCLGGLGVLHLLASFLPGLWFWGVDYWAEFSLPVRLGLLAALILSLIPGVARGVSESLSPLLRAAWFQLAVLAGAVVAFVIFRSQAHVYGDGYSFPTYFAGGQFPELSSQLLTQALDLVAHWLMYRFVVMPFGGDVAISYAIWGAIAGFLGAWAIMKIAPEISSDSGTRRLAIAAGLSSGTVVMWFGYVESYTLVNVTLLWTLLFALKAQRSARAIWPAWILWVLAVAFHQLAVALFPVVVWAHWRSRRSGSTRTDRSTAAALLGGGFLLWALATWVYRMAGPPIFVPLVNTVDSAYSAFAIGHLSDLGNLILFLSPFGVAGLVLWLWKSGAPDSARPAAAGVLAVASAAGLYFAFWVDPLIGAFRDWDLLAAFAIPLSMWGAVAVAERHPKHHVPRWLWVPVFGFALVHGGVFVATLQNAETAMLRVDRLTREDIHYSGGFFSGSRLPPWAAIVGRSFNRYDLAKDHLRARLDTEPDDALAWANLGNAYQKLSMFDSAAVCYVDAVKRDPGNAKYANNLGILRAQLDDVTGAREAFERCVEISDTAYGCRAMLGLVYINLGLLDKAEPVLNEAIAINPSDFSAYYHRGLVAEVRKDTAAAIQDYEAAVARGADIEDVYSRLVQLYQWSGTQARARAIAVARLWEQRFPGTADAPFLAGTTYFIDQKYDSANAEFARSLRRQPDRAMSAYYLATTFRLTGDPGRARDYAIQATRIDPAMALPYLELVYLSADAGDRENAVLATREYLRRAPGDSAMSYLQQFIE